MHALVYNGPWDLTVETVADPEVGPGEVLVRVEATGICGSDIHGFTGENGRRSPGQVMGHETVGRVERLGPGVDGPPVGAPVTVNPVLGCGQCPACAAGAEQSCPQRRILGVTPELVSSFADLLAVPAGNVVALPESMPIELGALVEPLAVGYHAAGRGDCSADDRVLVLGGGPIGQACVLAARRLGAQQVVVSEPDAHRRELAASLGAVGVDPTDGDLATTVEQALGARPSLVIDAVGTSRTLEDAFRCTGFGARVVLVGMGAPQVELRAYALSTEERTLIGSFCYSAQEFRDTAAWAAGAADELRPLIEGRVDMAGAPQAFSELGNGASPASKVLVYPHGVPDAADGG